MVLCSGISKSNNGTANDFLSIASVDVNRHIGRFRGLIPPRFGILSPRYYAARYLVLAEYFGARALPKRKIHNTVHIVSGVYGNSFFTRAHSNDLQISNLVRRDGNGVARYIKPEMAVTIPKSSGILF